MLTTPKSSGILSVEKGWICCPHCGKHIQRITEETTADKLPAWCRKCGRSFVLKIERGLSARRLSP